MRFLTSAYLYLGYLPAHKAFGCPAAANSGFVSNWVACGHGALGYTTATAYDPASVEGFPSFARAPELENPSLIPLFGDTASGLTAEEYPGYTFDPITACRARSTGAWRP